MKKTIELDQGEIEQLIKDYYEEKVGLVSVVANLDLWEETVGYMELEQDTVLKVRAVIKCGLNHD